MKSKFFIFILLAALCATTCRTVKAQTTFSSGIEVNGGVGLESQCRFSFGAAIIGGFNVTNKLFVGAIAGYEYFDALYMLTRDYYNSNYKHASYDYNYQPKNLLKLGGRFKLRLTDKGTSPFIGCDLGTAIQLAKTPRGNAEGLFLKPSIGFDIDLGDYTMCISVAYKVQNNSYGHFDFTDTEGAEYPETKAEMIDFSIGFLF